VREPRCVGDSSSSSKSCASLPGKPLLFPLPLPFPLIPPLPLIAMSLYLLAPMPLYSCPPMSLYLEPPVSLYLCPPCDCPCSPAPATPPPRCSAPSAPCGQHPGALRCTAGAPKGLRLLLTREVTGAPLPILPRGGSHCWASPYATWRPVGCATWLATCGPWNASVAPWAVLPALTERVELASSRSGCHPPFAQAC